MRLLNGLFIVTIGMPSCGFEEYVGKDTEPDPETEIILGKLPPTSTPPEQQSCINDIPNDYYDRINFTKEANIKNRDAAILAEQTRLGVKPLRPTTLLELAPEFINMYKPEVDPYPESVIAIGEEYNIREEGYVINHGKMDMDYVYETSPGSKEYFLIDRIGGNGIGGNGEKVVAEEVEYGLLNFSTTVEEGFSWHSWQVSDDNKLVRAYQNPTNHILDQFFICGCGSFGSEIPDYNKVFLEDAPIVADSVRTKYEIAIFKLPGNQIPEILPEGTFNAKFERSFYKKIFVPRTGLKCKKHEVVC